MLTFHRTSIMDSTAQTVVNTVNTVGVMGKGLAAAFKTKFPDMYAEYRQICLEKLLEPGSFWLWKGEAQWVLNFSTKKHWRNPSKLEYVERGLQEFVCSYERLGIREIAFPRLGCGNGGLDWGVVKPLMEKYLRNLPIAIYIHDFEKELGFLEHEKPIGKNYFAGDFEQFLSDIGAKLYANKGRLNTFAFSQEFSSEIDQSHNLYASGRANKLLADEDDLYRIWSVLMKSPLTREDLPEQPYENALVLFSILAYLPYIRLINIKSGGQEKVALELKKSPFDRRISDAGTDVSQEEFQWG